MLIIMIMVMEEVDRPADYDYAMAGKMILMFWLRRWSILSSVARNKNEMIMMIAIGVRNN